MPSYKVKDGQEFGKDKQHKAGAIVQLTEEEAGGFADKLELVESLRAKDGLIVSTPKQQEQPSDLRAAILAASDEELLAMPGIGEKSLPALRDWAQGIEPKPNDSGTADQAGDVVSNDQTPPPIIGDVEKQLETETGHDVVQTGETPPTFVETDKTIDVDLDAIDPTVDVVQLPDGSTIERGIDKPKGKSKA